MTDVALASGFWGSVYVASFHLLYISIPVLCGMLIRLAGYSLFSISVPVFFFWYYLILSHFGYLPLFWGAYEYRVFQGVTSSGLVYQLMLWSGFSLTLVCTGVLVASRLKDQKNQELDFVGELPTLNSAQKLFFAAITVLSVLITMDFLIRVPKIALVALFQGEQDLVLIRSQMTNGFSGPVPYHYYQLWFSTLLPFLTCVWYVNARSARSKSALMAFLVVFMVTFVISVADLQKAPAFWLIFIVACTHLSLVSRRRRAQVILLGAPALLILIIVIYGLFMGLEDRHPLEIASTAIQRIIVGGMTPLYFYLELFPSAVDFLGGTTLPNPRQMLPWDVFPYTRFVSDYLHPEFSGTNIVGSAPSAFWGELFINWGFLGLLVISPILGLLIYAVQYLVSMLPLDPVKPAALAWAMLHYSRLAETGISNFLIDERALVVFICCLTSMKLSNRRFSTE